MSKNDRDPREPRTMSAASPSVQSVSATRLHGMYDFQHEFVRGVNVIYAGNGKGKTTLLHILANALAGHYEQFVYLQFEMIEVRMADETVIAIRRDSAGGTATVDVAVNGARVARWRGERSSKSRLSVRGARERAARGRQQPSGGPLPPYGVSYFPAFRSMIDAWVSAEQPEAVRLTTRSRTPTEFARELFGQFVPEVGYSSLLTIDQELKKEIAEAFRRVSEAETGAMTRAAVDVYRGTLVGFASEARTEANLVDGVRALCERIERVSELLGRKPDTDLSALKEVATCDAATPLSLRALAVLGRYHDALRAVADEQDLAVASLRTYLDAVNRFLVESRMRLVVSGAGRAYVRHDGGGGRKVPLNTLSSGGRQIATMMYAATRLSLTPVVLIDEPELSLHVDWQRSLLSEMAGLTGSKQIIVATHSPEVSADYDVVQKFRPSESAEPIESDPLLVAEQDIVLTRVLENQS